VAILKLKMAVCEMCGRNENLVAADVEGAELKVCSKCAKFGKVKKNNFNSSNSNYNRNNFRAKPSYKKETVEESVVGNFAEILRRERERRGLSQEDFAKLINERESQLSKWESDNLTPDIDTAKKLQRILAISLVKVEQLEEEKQKEENHKPRGDVLTLGDFIKVKKRS
jgi:putative transcription factor